MISLKTYLIVDKTEIRHIFHECKNMSTKKAYTKVQEPYEMDSYEEDVDEDDYESEEADDDSDIALEDDEDVEDNEEDDNEDMDDLALKMLEEDVSSSSEDEEEEEEESESDSDDLSLSMLNGSSVSEENNTTLIPSRTLQTPKNNNIPKPPSIVSFNMPNKVPVPPKIQAPVSRTNTPRIPVPNTTTRNPPPPVPRPLTASTQSPVPRPLTASTQSPVPKVNVPVPARVPIQLNKVAPKPIPVPVRVPVPVSSTTPKPIPVPVRVPVPVSSTTPKPIPVPVSSTTPKPIPVPRPAIKLNIPVRAPVPVTTSQQITTEEVKTSMNPLRPKITKPQEDMPLEPEITNVEIRDRNVKNFNPTTYQIEKMNKLKDAVLKPKFPIDYEGNLENNENVKSYEDLLFKGTFETESQYTFRSRLSYLINKLKIELTDRSGKPMDRFTPEDVISFARYITDKTWYGCSYDETTEQIINYINDQISKQVR